MSADGPLGRIVALEGLSGTGKSRLARALTDGLPGSVLIREAYDRIWPRLSLAVADPEELLRVERSLLREELRRYGEAVKARRTSPWVFLDTGFIGPLTYSTGLGPPGARGNLLRPLRKALSGAAGRGTLGLADLTIYLDAPLRVVRERGAADPRGHPEIWQERHLRVGVQERAIWVGPMASILGPRFVTVSAAGRTDAIARRIRRILNGSKLPEPLSRRESGRLLGEAVRALRPGSATVKKGGRRPPNPST